tara:strand:- start:1548 stop:2255 length:708 start_codon:yes stop_codon:yes gene_type:complete
MPRQRKQTADYFPHMAVHGKTMYIIESKFGVPGYAFWFKLLELLCITPGHCYYCNTVEETAFLTAKTGFTDTETALSVLDTLASLGAIDQELWEDKGIWCQHLVDNLASMYKKRFDATVPDKPVSGSGNAVSGVANADKGARNPQSKVKESKVKESRSGGVEFQAYIKDLQTNRYPGLKVAELWADCQSWYADHNKPMRDAKRALNNWCKKELDIHPPKVQPLPTAKELKEGWKQ